MANALTGDFDVVAEFAVAAANRVIAAMHRSERLLHSVTIRVDDNPPPGSGFTRPTIVGSVDAFGDPVVNQRRIGTPIPIPGQLVAKNPIYSALDPVVNLENAGAVIVPIVPSHLQGRAQLQLFPPTLEVAPGSGSSFTLRMNIMSRYFADANTSPLAEFIRGELQITTTLSQVVSQAANVVDIDFKTDNAYINFSPAWSSQPLSAADLAGINLLIRNALRTSFLPSNATLPSFVQQVQFKTVPATPGALAVLLNMNTGAGNPASMNNVFLAGSDDFAFAVSLDYLRAILQPTINSLLAQSYSFTIPIDLLFTTVHISYSITLTSASVDLPGEQILLTIQGQAVQTSHKSYAPSSFTFTAKLAFSLQVDGDTADLVPGDVSLDTSSWVVNLFRGSATNGMKQVEDQALNQSGAYDAVHKIFNADATLGVLLESLLPSPRRRFIFQTKGFQLAYTSVEIRSTGIIMHGSLAVTGWPPAYVEFEPIPAGGVGPPGEVIPHGPSYSALKSWIPGGTIQQYEWSTEGQTQPFLIDPNKFVYQQPPPQYTDWMASTAAVSGFVPLCLTVRGTRLSASGPVVAEPVVGSVCGYTLVSLIPINIVTTLNGSLPSVALTYPDSQGLVQVVGHAAAQPNGTGGGVPNLIVHFADDKSASQLETLPQALRTSKREDAATAILAVLGSDQIAKARYASGIIYAEDQDGAWERLFGVKSTQRPLTLIVAPKGNVLWQKEGPLDSQTLAAALQKMLVPNASVRLGMLRVNLRIGQPAPNFLFEYAPGRELALRKLTRRACTMVFWKSASKPSIAAVLDLQKTAGQSAGKPPMLLAINDGDTSELARAVAAEAGFSATLVTDPDRDISLAYGVNIWPTIIVTDASGMITGIRYGHGTAEPVASASPQATASR
ncbi:MAG TPA: redoxin domain-containing protein [Terriglobales bacterium]|jgi:peroxiredoxin|nr:redoxin domain-containing protein [Terriglobales bacterium]